MRPTQTTETKGESPMNHLFIKGDIVLIKKTNQIGEILSTPLEDFLFHGITECDIIDVFDGNNGVCIPIDKAEDLLEYLDCLEEERNDWRRCIMYGVQLYRKAKKEKQ
jgi:3-methyladenine DNA glycosylase AlkD